MAESTELVNQIYHAESRRVYASLVRLLGDLDLAEEAMQEAFTAAAKTWPIEGVPQQPRAWLVSTGRFKAIDLIRKQERFRTAQEAVAERIATIAESNEQKAGQEIEDDRLRLIFACCHPAIDRMIQVPLTLREVCGLTTEEIARAFLVSPTTMAQRIVRGKSKIRDARIPIAIPGLAEMPERLEAVLSVIYLVFNEGYSATRGSSLTRADLTSEAIRLGRLLLELLPDPEVMGLLALMLLHDSRRETRVDAAGDVVLLEQQDRSRWNRTFIEEGQRLVQRSLLTRRFGVYTLQAAISAVHSEARTSDTTDWAQIVALYDMLLLAQPSPVVELNRAVAVSQHQGAEKGLEIVDAILQRGELANYHLAHTTRGELLRLMGDISAARDAFQRALALAQSEPDRRFLKKKLGGLT